MNKKAMSIEGYMAGLLIFSLVIVAFYVGSAQIGGFWQAYSYTPGGNVTSFNLINNISSGLGTNLVCDVNPEQAGCPDKNTKSLESGDIIARMVQGGYGGLITILKIFSIPKYLIIEVGTKLQIPPIITTAFYTLLLMGIVITIIFIVFNRSDT